MCVCVCVSVCVRVRESNGYQLIPADWLREGHVTRHDAVFVADLCCGFFIMISLIVVRHLGAAIYIGVAC